MVSILFFFNQQEDEIVILGMGPRIRTDEDYFAVFDGRFFFPCV